MIEMIPTRNTGEWSISWIYEIEKFLWLEDGRLHSDHTIIFKEWKWDQKQNLFLFPLHIDQQHSSILLDREILQNVVNVTWDQEIWCIYCGDAQNY